MECSQRICTPPPASFSLMDDFLQIIGRLGWKAATAKHVSAIAPGVAEHACSCVHALTSPAVAEAARSSCLQLLKWRRQCGVGAKEEAGDTDA